MRLTGSIRPTATTDIVAEGHDRGSAYDALAALVPATWTELEENDG